MSEQEKKDEEVQGEAEETQPEETAETPEETTAESETEEAEEQTEEEPAEAGDEQKENSPKEEKRSFFHKKKDKKDLQIEELTDKVKRQLAEFENFRKRTEKEKASMYEVGARSVIEKILPIVDNFERGMAVKPEDENTPFTDGMEKIYKQLQSALEAMEVTPIEAVGKEFDPHLHNAVMQDEEADVPENTIVQEFQKGYTYRGSVIRYSMVKVRK